MMMLADDMFQAGSHRSSDRGQLIAKRQLHDVTLFGEVVRFLLDNIFYYGNQIYIAVLKRESGAIELGDFLNLADHFRQPTNIGRDHRQRLLLRRAKNTDALRQKKSCIIGN